MAIQTQIMVERLTISNLLLKEEEMKFIIFNLYNGKQIGVKVIIGLSVQKIIARESEGIKIHFSIFLFPFQKALSLWQ